MMMNVMILVCALGMAQGDCSMETATAVVQGPEVSSPIMCGLHGQAYLADTSLAAYVEDGHYLKIRCTAGQRPGRGLARAPLLEAVRDTAAGPATVEVE